MAVDYRVELDVYNGPMDLLLYLIKKDELDIYDIPIASITDSYVQYVQMLREMSKENGLDINVAGDFLVMAAPPPRRSWPIRATSSFRSSSNTSVSKTPQPCSSGSSTIITTASRATPP